MKWISLARKQGWWIVMKNIVRRYLSVVGHGGRMSGRCWRDNPWPILRRHVSAKCLPEDLGPGWVGNVKLTSDTSIPRHVGLICSRQMQS